MPLFRAPMSPFKAHPTPALNHEELVHSTKALFSQRHYKKCANRCLQYLSAYGNDLHPAYKVYLYFFAGISNDSYARGMPSRSPLIPSTLDEAEAFFSKAQDLLASARVVNPASSIAHLSQPRSHDDGTSSEDGRSSRSMYRSRSSEDSGSRPSTAATTVSIYSNADTDILYYDCEDTTPQPVSPLNVKKYETLPDTPSKPAPESTSLLSLDATSPGATTSRPSPRLASFYLLKFPPTEAPSEPAPTPSPILRQLEDDYRLSLFDQPPPTAFEDTTTPSDPDDEIPFPDEDFCFHEPSHIDIYNSQLASFATMLAAHMASLRRFRESVAALNDARIAGKHVFFSTWKRDGEGKREMSPEERMQRVLKGRERKWERKRFDPTRIRELCEIAIAEL